jgi:hypothetical protein
MNTPFTNAMSSDGFSWSQANPIQVDRYNHIFSLAQLNSTGDHKFIFSNDAGKTWSENAVAEKYMVRASVAYDSRNDIIHVLWNAANPKDGLIYRRYDIKRDSLDNIVAISRDPAINLQLDFQTGGVMQYEHPLLLWLGDKQSGNFGRLVAIWSAHNDAPTLTNEIRVSQRVLSNSAEDGLAANWRAFMAQPDPQTTDNPAITTPAAPVNSAATITARQDDSTTTSTLATENPPQVAYSPIFASAKASAPYASALYKTSGSHAGDFYFFYSSGNTTWEWRRAAWNSLTNDWSGGLTPPAIISAINRAGNDNGYNLKQQLGSKPVEDTVKDRVYFGFATWKDNTQGDTWSHIYVDASDKLSPIADVYSAEKAHSYAPTGDITFDEVSGRLITIYLKTDKAGTYARSYDGNLAVGAESLIFNSDEADIPLLWQGGRYAGNNQPELLVLFRGTTRPYQGYFGTIEIINPAGQTSDGA